MDMAVLSAADLRDAVRTAAKAMGLQGFFRILPPGQALLITDALRRGAGAKEQRAFCSALDQMGFGYEAQEGLLRLTPGEGLLAALASQAEERMGALPTIGEGLPNAAAWSLARRLLRCPVTCGLSASGQRLLVETLRLPEPDERWREIDRLRPMLAAMLRSHERNGMHEAGALLAARLANR